jgi:UDP-N-acetylglucosamine 4,6-dehydratase/5-epimerase
MTRFWIKLEDGANFVERSVHMMRGGEIFIPKVPSMRITDLAAAIGPQCEQETVGIRPGEKLHELLLTRDDARHTLEFKDFFVIQPAIHMWNDIQSTTYGGEQGRPVPADFEYASNNNDLWLDAPQLKSAID